MFNIKKYKRFSKKMVLFLTVFALIAGAFPLVGIVSLLKTSADSGDQSWVPTIADMSYNHWPDRISYTDVASGGVKITWQDSFTNVRAGLNKAVPFDGMTIRIANLQAGANSNGKFAIVFGNQAEINDITYDAAQKDRPALIIEAGGGNLIMAPGDHFIVSQNNALKYENLQGKEFEIRFAKGSDGLYQIIVTVGDAVVKGTIPADVMASFVGFDPSANTKAVFTPWRFPWDDPATEGLSLEYKSFGWTAPTPIIDLPAPTVAQMSTNWWTSNLFLTDLASGGVKIEWQDAFTNIRAGSNQGVPLDGMAIHIANLQAGTDSDGKFAIIFGNHADVNDLDYSSTDYSKPVLIVDAGGGNLIMQPAEGDAAADIVLVSNNDALKYANLQGKDFVIRFEKGSNGLYQVIVDIGGTEVKGTISARLMASFEGFDPAKDTKAVFTPWCFNWDTPNKVSLSLEYKGFGQVVPEPSVVTPEQVVIPAPAVADMSTNFWSESGMMSYTNGASGGVKIAWTDAFVNVRAGVNKAVPFDGLAIRINNLQAVANSNGMFAIVFGNSDEIADITYDPDHKERPALIVNTHGGSLIMAPDDKVIIPGNDALKYENLQGKEFVIRFKKGTDGLYQVIATIGNTELVGTISADVMASFVGFDPTGDVKAVLTPWRFPWDDPPKESLSLEVTGFGHHAELSVPDIQNMTPDFWGATRLFYTDLASGGVKIEWKNGITNVRAGFNAAVPLDGMILRLNNLQKAENSPGNFAIVFGNHADINDLTYAESDKNKPALVLDTGGGNLIMQPAEGDAAADILLVQQNDALKYENLQGKLFEIRFSKMDGGAYQVTVAVGGQEIKGTISARLMASFVGFDPTKDTKAVITPWRFDWDTPNSEDMSLEYKGFGRVEPQALSQEKVDDVIAAISAIGTVVLKNGSPVRLARKAYDALNASEKLLVANYDVLVAAEARYTELTNEADKELISMNRSRGLLTSSPYAYVQQTINVDWKNFIKLTDVPGGKGLHYRFTGALTNVREAYAGAVGFDGLLLQFDNLDRDDNTSGGYALYFSDAGTSDYGGEYLEDSGNRAMALVFDPNEGSVKVYPGGTEILRDSSLTYAEMANKRWSVLFEEPETGLYKMTVTVGSKTISGIIPGTAFQQAEAFNDLSACTVTLSCWGSNQTYSMDFLGFKATYLATEVIDLIDAIGLVTVDSGPAIEAAEAAYDALPEKSQDTVKNYKLLKQSRELYNSLDFDRMIESTIEAIDDIGNVTVMSGSKIEVAEELFNRLTTAQRAKVTNADKFRQATQRFYSLIAPNLFMESDLYGPNLSGEMLISEANITSWWKGAITTTATDDNRIRFTWTDAVRNMRNGPGGTYDVNGLYLQLANITKDEGMDGTRLAILIGSNEWAEYSDAGTGALALVLDTVEGTIRAFPGGSGTPLIQSDLLKHANLEDKVLGIKFGLSEEGLVQVYVNVGDTRLKGVIKSKTILETQLKSASKVTVLLTCWTDNDDGATDGSLHSFSADLVSIREAGNYAFEGLFAVIDAIDKLPDTVTDDNADDILAVYSQYGELPRAMRQRVSNYDKLAKLLKQVYELRYDADYIPNVPVDPDNPDNPDNPEDPENSGNNVSTGVSKASLLWIMAAILSASSLIVVNRRRKSRRISR